MNSLRNTASAWLACGQPAVLVEVLETRGSVPREHGTRMLVSAQEVAGTIGGGHLELKAIAQAKAWLGGSTVQAQRKHYPLGPALGQCCGGAVTLEFSTLDAAALQRWPLATPRFHLQLYGAGHVGRAIVRALAPVDCLIDWIDEREEEFPASVEGDDAHWPPHIRKVCVDAMDAVEDEVVTAPPGAFYLALTHRHDLDLRISEAILARGDFGFFGLIGSKTKRNRFIHRFEQRGIHPSVIARMTCPIGIEGISGKEPEIIALSVAAQLLRVASALEQTQSQAAREAMRRSTRAMPTMPIATKQTNDQLAIEPPRNVQSTAEQSPLPLKIMGIARLSGKVSIIP